MTSKEFISCLAPVDTERLIAIFDFLADHWYEFRLINGQRLNDGIDASAFHREVAAALRLNLHPPTMGEFVVKDVCMTCAHVHEQGDCCGVNLGKGGVCECKAEVRA
jgi:hypothetical protein